MDNKLAKQLQQSLIIQQQNLQSNNSNNTSGNLIKGLVGNIKKLESPSKRQQHHQKSRKNYSCSPKIKIMFEGQQQQQQQQSNENQNSGKKNNKNSNNNGRSNNNNNNNNNSRISKKKQSLQPIQQQQQQQIQGNQSMLISDQQQQNQKKAMQRTHSTTSSKKLSNQIQPGALKTILDVIKEKKTDKNGKNSKNNNSNQNKENNGNNSGNNNNNNNSNSNNSNQKKPKQKQQKLKLTQLKDLKPINLEQEKVLFFQKMHQYNPIFLYSTNDILFSIQNPHTKHMSLAVKIMNAVLDQYKQEDQWNIQEGGAVLTQEETQQYFQKYIDELEIQDLISFEFSENTISPTSCIHNNVEGVSKVVIGLPIAYRKNRIMGVLNHEIGTHFLRKYNEKQQKWHKYRKKYDLQNHSKVEEGLACVNQLFETSLDTKKKPFLYKAALHYYASVQASYMSFQDLFRDLERYIKNPEERWKECVRVKRGITDTQQKNGQYKDQIYLRGAVKVLTFRNQLNFHNLHAGKITVKDCIKMTEKNQISLDKTKMPYFLKDIGVYKKALERIAVANFLQ